MSEHPTVPSPQTQLPIPPLINTPLKILARLNLATHDYADRLLSFRRVVYEQCSLLLHLFLIFVAVDPAFRRRSTGS